MKQVGRELGVRYVLEGSVRRGGSRVRVTAQLIDGETGNHLWAERYDRDLADVFAIQDEITEAVATAIEPTVAETERQRALRRPPESLGAWEAYQRGLWHLARMSAEDCQKAKHFLQRSIELDSNFAPAYARLTIPIIAEATMYQVRSVSESLEEALTMAQRAISLDPTDAVGHSRLGLILTMRGDYEGGSAEGRLAVAMSPNSALALADLGLTYVISGRPREGVELLSEAMRRDPYDPIRLIRWTNIAMGHYYLREYESAVEAARGATRAYPDHPWAFRWLAAALGQLGRVGEGREALQKCISIAPTDFATFTHHRRTWSRLEDYQHLPEGLRKAGWDG